MGRKWKSGQGACELLGGLCDGHRWRLADLEYSAVSLTALLGDTVGTIVESL